MSTDRIDSYRLVEQIGRGAAGTVFVGEYGALRRPIAIKILHEHLVADGSADRMLAEARALCLLDHPGIVKVLDCGMTDDGRAYIVMEHLAGELLHQRLRRGALREEQAVLFARQLASALEVAHAAGIVHRDVKPENAFIVPDPDVPGGERIKLLDFGIAKHGDQERTQTGVVLGTPAYMAPEQFTASRRVDHRADIYALGVVIYTMSTGSLPFVGSNTDELRAEHAYCLPRPATASGTSTPLSELIDRCLAKDPRDRFASMAELGDALRELEHEAITTPARIALGSLSGVIAEHADVTEHDDLVEPGDLEHLDTGMHASSNVRSSLPWWAVLGAVGAITAALTYVVIGGGSSTDEAAPPARLVEQDSAPAAAQPTADTMPAVEPPTRAPTVIEAKTDPPRRDSTRARPRPARARKVDARPVPAEPEIKASTKEEEYARVTPPTLY